MQNEMSQTHGLTSPVSPALPSRLHSNIRFEDAAASVEAALNHLRQTEDMLARQLADLQLYINNNRQINQAH